MLNRIIYWFIQITWGFITFVIGLLITLVLKCFKSRTYKNGYGFITTIGGNWGGLSFGPFSFSGRYNEIDGPCPNVKWYNHTRKHEFGHSIQVLFLGPFFIFIVAIPSAIRYWYYTISIKKGKSFPSDWYDSILFEKTATKWGTKAIEKIEK